jgi:DNA-binding NarL/FixJ family response regulator
MPVRALIVEDQAIMQEGMRALLAADSDLEVIGKASTAAEAIVLARSFQPGVVLLDSTLPDMNAVQATAAIREACPRSQVIVLTNAVDEQAIVATLKAGAVGYLFKDVSATELRQAVKAAAGGQLQLSNATGKALLEELRLPSSASPLTERELAVLRLLAQGLANKEIARTLKVSEATIKSHVSNILSKLGVSSRTQAALYAMRVGLVWQPGGRPRRGTR